MPETWPRAPFQFVDKLYGEIRFPAFISALVRCPAVMRLREVRMANINFIRYPGFANATRFEHSLGTCYLASLAARSLGLAERESLTLMAAALYHDAATPAFAHATEEVLADSFSFDHERKLFEILTGDPAAGRVASGRYLPIFLGRRAILDRVCRSPAFRHLRVDPLEVAKTASGQGHLGTIIKADIDLDNIDNVIRAALHMGLRPDPALPIRLATNFTVSEGICHLSPHAIDDIVSWQETRWRLYDAIFADTEDFALQSMLKFAMQLAIRDGVLDSDDWCATDDELLYCLLPRSADALAVVERMRLGDLYPCLLVTTIDDQAGAARVLDYKLRLEFEQSLSGQVGQQLIIGFFADRRIRELKGPLAGLKIHSRVIRPRASSGLVVGIFTPEENGVAREQWKEVRKKGIARERRNELRVALKRWFRDGDMPGDELRTTRGRQERLDENALNPRQSRP